MGRPCCCGLLVAFGFESFLAALVVNGRGLPDLSSLGFFDLCCTLADFASGASEFLGGVAFNSSTFLFFCTAVGGFPFLLD